MLFRSNKGNFNEYLGTITQQEAITNGKAAYRKIFESNSNAYFDKKFKNEIVNTLKPNQKVTIVILNDVAMYSPIQIQKITSDEMIYKKTPFLFLIFSYLKNEFINESLSNLQILRFEEKGSWSVATFQRP